MLRWLAPGLALAAGLLLARFVPAPGQALEVSLDHPPRDIQVGVPFEVGFSVYELPDNQPRAGLAPLVVAQHAATGQQVTVAAQPARAGGHYAARLILPAAGEWQWAIHPDPQGAYPPVSLNPLEALDHAAGSARPPDLALLALAVLAVVPLLALVWGVAAPKGRV